MYDIISMLIVPRFCYCANFTLTFIYVSVIIGKYTLLTHISILCFLTHLHWMQQGFNALSVASLSFHLRWCRRTRQKV